MIPVLYIDGWHGVERELTVIPRPHFPFRTSPLADVFTRGYERDYMVHPCLYIPRIATRTAWTNLLTWSEDFANAVWTKTNLTNAAGTGPAPDGQPALGQLRETVTNAEHAVAQAAIVEAAPTEVSIFSAGGGRAWVRLAFTDSAATTFHAFFNIASGYVGARSAGVTAGIVGLGLGQFRCVLRFTPAAGAGTFKAGISTNGIVFAYAGDVGAGVSLWGAQVTTGTRTPYVSTTVAARTILAPDHDKSDPLAFLIEEQDPLSETSETEKIRRTFCRVPRQQVIPSSMFITKPPLAGDFPQVIGDSLVLQPNPDLPTYYFYRRLFVTSDTGPVSAFFPTGGTYTLTFAGATTGAIAYDASAATLQTAINALAGVTARGGTVVTGAYNTAAGFAIIFNLYAGALVDAAGLTTAYGIAAPSVALENGGFRQNVAIYFSRTYGPVSIASSLTPSYANPIGTSFGSDTSFGFFIGNSATAFPPFVSGGTFTITVFGQTTAPIIWDPAYSSYDPSIAGLPAAELTPAAVAIAAALNALSNVAARGGYRVIQSQSTSGYGGFHPAHFSCILNSSPGFVGGDYTITLFTQTTAPIAYNASTATIEAALNALSSVSGRGGAIVSGIGFTGNEISFAIDFPNNPTFSLANSLTPAGAGATVTPGTRGQAQTILFNSTSAVRRITVPAHGLTDADAIYLIADGTTFPDLRFPVFRVVDGSTLEFPLTPGSAFAALTQIFNLGKLTATYSGGTKLTRTKRVTDFFLPGVTPGIATADDIPLPVYQGDAVSLLAAILAAQTSINYEVGELVQWRDSPILARTITTLNAATL